MSWIWKLESVPSLKSLACWTEGFTSTEENTVLLCQLWGVFSVFKGLPWWLRWLSICLQCGRPWFDPWVGKIPWRRKWQSTPVLLPGKSDGQRSLVGYSPWGRKESQLKQLSTYICFLSPLKQKFHGDRDFSICLTLKSPGPRTMPDE